MEKVMIVDDSSITRNVVMKYFSELNVPCKFIEATDGSEALELLRKNPVDLVLLDWNMPKLSGIDFLRQVRAMEKFKKLPIVMVTSEAAKYNIIEALKAGATDYVTKPISEKLFKSKMAKIINGEDIF